MYITLQQNRVSRSVKTVYTNLCTKYCKLHIFATTISNFEKFDYFRHASSYNVHVIMINIRYITIYSNSEEAKNNFKNDISSKNIFDKLNKNLTNNPNENYNILEEEISNSLEIHMNKKTVKFNRRKHKRDPWITFGILHSINRKNSLYQKNLKKLIANQMFTKLGNSSLINLRIPCEEL